MRYFVVCALLLSLAVPAAAPAQSLDAASLLALHREYVGWQFGDGTFTSIRQWGEAVNTKPDPGATPEPSEPMTLLRRGIVFRETQVSQQTGRGFNWGFTGNLFWESNENGFTHPVIGDAQKADISYEFLVEEGTPELAGTLRDPVTIDGVSYPVVRVSPTAGFPIDLAVDPHTGAYVRAVIDPGGNYETTYDIISYQEVEPGKRVIASYRYHGSSYTFEWSKFLPNVPVADDELRPPPQTATWTFANPNPFPIDLRNKFIIVNAAVNGVSGTFMIDTGASSIVLTTAFARKAHVRRKTDTGICGIGGCVGADTDIIDTLVIGGNTLSNVIAISSPLGNYYHGIFGGLNAGNGEVENIDGILGYDLLGGAIVRLNFGASTMSILDPTTTDLTHEPGAVATVDLSGGQPMIPLTVDGDVTVNAILDTGGGIPILYSPDLIYKYHIAALRRTSAIYGVGGGALANCGMLGRVSIGPISYEGASACEDPTWSGSYMLLGIDFLRHFNIVLDYPQGVIIMNPLPSTF